MSRTITAMGYVTHKTSCFKQTMISNAETKHLENVIFCNVIKKPKLKTPSSKIAKITHMSNGAVITAAKRYNFKIHQNKSSDGYIGVSIVDIRKVFKQTLNN